MADILHESSSANMNMNVEESQMFNMDEMMEECDTDKLLEKEENILKLAELYKKEGNATELVNLLRSSKQFYKVVSEEKAATLVKTFIDYILEVESDTEVDVNLCKEFIEWAKEERRVFLRQSLQVRLVGSFFNSRMYSEALTLSAQLLNELECLEDKRNMVEVLLEESKVYNALKNVPKAIASLTSARAMSSTICCPPTLHAALDLHTGILHTADGKDFKTAFSYFYEAFDTYNKIDSPRALTALKYMMLCKIILNQLDEVQHIINNDLLLKYMGRGIDAIKAVADASCKRSLAGFVEVMRTYKKEFEEDDIVSTHLNTLYDRMLEQNLHRIIEPYSKVEIEYIAERINLPKESVQRKLCDMILDKKMLAKIDNVTGVLVLLDDKKPDIKSEVFDTINKTVTILYPNLDVSHSSEKLSKTSETDMNDCCFFEDKTGTVVDVISGAEDKGSSNTPMLSRSPVERYFSNRSETVKIPDFTDAAVWGESPYKKVKSAIQKFKETNQINNVPAKFSNDSVINLQNVPEDKAIKSAVKRKSNVERDERSIFVGGIHAGVVEQTLKEYFATFGSVEDVTIPKDSQTEQHRGYAFVKFAKKTYAEAALQCLNHVILGKRVDVSTVKRKNKKQ